MIKLLLKIDISSVKLLACVYFSLNLNLVNWLNATDWNPDSWAADRSALVLSSHLHTSITTPTVLFLTLRPAGGLCRRDICRQREISDELR